jgi:hypothetical protein
VQQFNKAQQTTPITDTRDQQLGKNTPVQTNAPVASHSDGQLTPVEQSNTKLQRAKETTSIAQAATTTIYDGGDAIDEVVVTGYVTDEVRAWRRQNLDAAGNYIGNIPYSYNNLSPKTRAPEPYNDTRHFLNVVMAPTLLFDRDAWKGAARFAGDIVGGTIDFLSYAAAHSASGDAAMSIMAQDIGFKSTNLGNKVRDLSTFSYDDAFIGEITEDALTFGSIFAPSRAASYLSARRSEFGFAANTQDDFVTFYHGTSPENASQIRLNGIDLSKSKLDNDFGVGFYMTTSKSDAIESAKMMSKSVQDVVEFRLPKSELDNLSILRFDSPNQEWANFVSINKQLDVPYLPPKEWSPRVFDLIEGPLYKGMRRDGTLRNWVERADQTSIHTDNAVKLFNRYLVQ